MKINMHYKRLTIKFRLNLHKPLRISFKHQQLVKDILEEKARCEKTEPDDSLT